MNRYALFAGIGLLVVSFASTTAAANESAGGRSGANAPQASSTAGIPPGQETGLVRETILQSEVDVAMDGCEPYRQLNRLRLRARPGGSERSFEVPHDYLASQNTFALENYASIQTRGAIDRVTVTNSNAMRSAQRACTDQESAEAALEQFFATTNLYGLSCGVDSVLQNARGNNFQFNMTRSAINQTNIDYLGGLLERYITRLQSNENLRVNYAGGKPALIRDLNLALNELNAANREALAGVFFSVEARQAAIQIPLISALRRIRQAYAAVNDGTQFSRGCDPRAQYVVVLTRQNGPWTGTSERPQ